MREHLRLYFLIALYILINPVQMLFIFLCNLVVWVGEVLENIAYFVEKNLMIGDKIRIKAKRLYDVIRIKSGKWR